MHQKGGYALALTAVFFWSLNVLFAQRFSTSITPIEFAFGRWFFAFWVLLPLGIRDIYHNRAYFMKHIPWIIGLALSGIVLDNTLIYLAAHTLDAVNLSLLNLLGPIFLVIIFAIYLKEKINIGILFGIALSLFGVILIITQGRFFSLNHLKFVSGNIWMILNAFCFGLYSFLQFKRPSFISQTSLLTITVLTGDIILAPFFITEHLSTSFHFSFTEIGVFIYLGIFNSVLAYLAWNTALIRLGPLKTGIIYYLQPLFSMIGAYFVLQTPITSFQVIGGLIVITGVYVVNHFQNKALKKAG